MTRLLINTINSKGMIKLVQLLLKRVVVALALTTIILGCDETETYRQTSNYFPLDNHAKWKYQWEYGCGCPEKFWPPVDTFVLQVIGDTILNGKTYSKIGNKYGSVSIRRQEGEQYFIVNLSDGTESVFLDTAAPIGKSWSVGSNQFWKNQLTMQSHFNKMTVNNIVYHDIWVVEDEHTYFYSGDSYSNYTFHYYAAGIGEILTRYAPNPYSYLPFGYKTSLLKFK